MIGWEGLEPHYVRVLRGEKGEAVRQMVDAGFHGDLGDPDLGDMFNIDKIGAIKAPEMHSDPDQRCLVEVFWVYRVWLLEGSPLFQIGPLMDREFLNLGHDLMESSGFSKEFNRLVSRLPFNMSYIETTSGNGVTLGAYFFKRTVQNKKGENVPSLAIAMDSGHNLVLSHIFDRGDGVHIGPGAHGLFDIDSELLQENFMRITMSAKRMLAVVLGLLRYLESINKEVKDPTPQIKREILSGKKSKIRKAINRQAGKRKIWIEPTLERKAKSDGMAGSKLTSGHIRRGHLHTYYVGAKLDADGTKIPLNRREKVVKFVAPTWVGPRQITMQPKEYGIRAK